ncbi:MAG TPA: pitrilysin family protein [Gemmatimonadaceae bacterium]|nr:pitrilysin family protein [Gemmatimonadaceae bacterium]
MTGAASLVPVDTLRLENGLFVVLSEDHTVPVVAVNLWYHVGSANERPGRTGFAHLFEHMLFQGSAHVGANEHFELVQRAGGTLNGSTWLDRTNYYETLPASQLALGLWLEADRMGALLPAMTQQKLDTQRDVVKNERRWTVDNQPYGTWWEKLPALCFPEEHPFHHSLIGSMEDLSAASLEDVTEFFRTYYTPDNAVLTIAGDFDRQEAERLVRAYFGPIARGGGRPALGAMDLPPRFGGWRRELVPDDVAVPRVFLAFRSPVFGSDAYYTASLCAAILGTGRGSRLHRTLVRDRQLASVATAFTFDLAKGTDLLVIDATARPGVTAEALEEGIVSLVDTLSTAGVSDEERARVTALEEMSFISGLQSAGERADRLSRFATYLGEPRLVNEHLPRLRRVTTKDITAFAREQLGPDNRAALAYVPRESSANGSPPAASTP